jgi:uncharacterized protein YjiS (DUF1127 family)
MSIQLTAGQHGTAVCSGERAVSNARSSKLIPIVRLLGTWMRRSAERRALREVAQDARLLSDIGLTRSQALREAEKLFWRG